MRRKKNGQHLKYLQAARTVEGRKLRFTIRLDDHWRDANKATSHDLKDLIEALLVGRKINPSKTNAIRFTIKRAQF